MHAALRPGAGRAAGDGAAAVGEAVVAALAAAAPRAVAGVGPPPLLPAASARCGLAEALAAAADGGVVALDGVQREYAASLLAPPRPPPPAPAAAVADPVDLDSRAAAVADVLPGYGRGFVVAALRACGHDPAAVLQVLLDGNLPPELVGLDAGLEVAPPLAGEAAAATAPPPPPRARPVPRATSRFLSGAARHPDDAAAVAAAALAAQWETASEASDDSGGRAGVAADAAAADADDAADSASRAWVVDGKVYAYKRAGAREVAGRGAVAAALRADVEAAAAVHGLGAGGNRAAFGGGDAPPGFGADRGHGGRLPGAGRGGGRGARGRGRAAHHQRERADRKAAGSMG